jgi:hypothetical protein
VDLASLEGHLPKRLTAAVVLARKEVWHSNNHTPCGCEFQPLKELMGHNITQHDVVVGIADVAGRVTARNARDITFANVAATITVPSGVRATTVQTQLSTSHSLAQGLAILLRGVDGMSSALTVSNVQVVLGTAVSAVYSQLAGPTEVSGSGQLEDAVTTSPPQLRGVAATSSLAAGKGPCGSFVLASVIIAAAALGHVYGL